MGSLAHEIFNEWMMNDSGILFSDNYEDFDLANVGSGLVNAGKNIGLGIGNAASALGNNIVSGIKGVLSDDPAKSARWRDRAKANLDQAAENFRNVGEGFRNAGNGFQGVVKDNWAQYNPYAHDAISDEQARAAAAAANPTFQDQITALNQQLATEREANARAIQEAADTARKYADGTYKNMTPEQARAMSMPGATLPGGTNPQITPMSPEQVKAYADERAASYIPQPQPVVDPNEDQGVPYTMPQVAPKMPPMQTAQAPVPTDHDLGGMTTAQWYNQAKAAGMNDNEIASAYERAGYSRYGQKFMDAQNELANRNPVA